MKKLIYVVPAQLNEDGTLFIKKLRSLRLAVCFLKDSYEITLLVQSYRGKVLPAVLEWGISVIYDSSTPEYQTDISRCLSRFQSSYCRRADREIAENTDGGTETPGILTFDTFRAEYDSLIAWDGCSPWCLATATRLLAAKKRLVWVQEDPNLYLIRADHFFYAKLCGGFDAILASEDGIKSELDSICEESSGKRNSTVVNPPIDSSWFWEQSKQPCEYAFEAEKINLLAVSGMSRECAMERLPGWLSNHQDEGLPIHCYLIGDGERMNRYIQQIAIHSVDHMVTLVGWTENPYPYIRRCDALLVCEEEKHPEPEAAAQAFGVPVISMEQLEQCYPELKKRQKTDEPPVSAWKDRDKLIKILEER